ncbi:MAG: ABC transporter substrate-binding protein, partial [Actinomycetota bacterium]
IAAEVGIEPGAESYTTAVDDALAANPDAIYVITYYPEAGVIAKDMAARNATAKCLADYSAFDAEYVVEATPAGVKRCPVVGLPGIDDFPGSETLVPSFRKKFGSSPGSQAPFAYDAVRVLAQAAGSKAGFAADKLLPALLALKGFEGWTGSIMFEQGTGNRVPALVVVDSVNEDGVLGIDQSWAAAAGASAG